MRQQDKIHTTAGPLEVGAFIDTTPGDEYAALTLSLGGRQVDLPLEDAVRLLEQVSRGVEEISAA